MKRNIIKIDEEKCTGCGACAMACAEGALEIIDGKAKLISESYCDGLGMCLPQCPAGAISIEQRESLPFDNQSIKKQQNTESCFACPGLKSKIDVKAKQGPTPQSENNKVVSQLAQWPCQLKLVPSSASFLNNANLLVAADCTTFAYADIHNKFMKNRVVLIGCPKLDGVNYTEKLTEILKTNNIKSITALRMEVPCCSGLSAAVKNALINSKKMIPWQIVTISINGEIIEE